MPTERGFVEALGVGRAGLVEATVLHGDGSTALYTIADLDADPERFNERLSKFGILRDAMDRAEPVEIIYGQGDDTAARAIESVKRLTRDVLARPTNTSAVSGSVIGIGAAFEVQTGPSGEATDRALVAILSSSGAETFIIPIQSPERATALAMIDVLRDAQAAGAEVTVTFVPETRYIVQVARNDIGGFGRDTESDHFSAFVEEITHAPVSNLMLVSVTTAPEFQTDGNVVPLINFTPELRHLAVVFNSPEYLLLEAALRDKLRVELFTLRRRGKQDSTDDDRTDTAAGATATVERDLAAERGVAAAAAYEAARSETVAANEAAPVSANVASVSSLRMERRVATASNLPQVAALVRGVTLQHALCTASRPVWIEINRRALDVGPDDECVEGLPSNDMRPRTLRELDLPYRAAWIGYGCFNHGVYRIQIVTDRDIKVLVDGDEICLHLDEDGTTIFGHACLDGDHEIRVIFENWKCKAKYDMDVYRIR